MVKNVTKLKERIARLVLRKGRQRYIAKKREIQAKINALRRELRGHALDANKRERKRAIHYRICKLEQLKDMPLPTLRIKLAYAKGQAKGAEKRLKEAQGSIERSKRAKQLRAKRRLILTYEMALRAANKEVIPLRQYN